MVEQKSIALCLVEEALKTLKSVSKKMDPANAAADVYVSDSLEEALRCAPTI
jgi:hypothetical protein